MTRLAERIKTLSPEKRRQFIQLLVKRGVAVADLPIPPRQSPRDTFPLSFSQERLWFLHQMEPEGTAYNLFAPLELPADFRTDLLERAWNELLRRHESLRTRFTLGSDGEPAQKVEPFRALPLPVVELGGLELAACRTELCRLSARIAKTRFDLRRGSPWRLVLARWGGSSRGMALFLVIHHIATDAVSMRLIHRELQELYEAFASRRPSSLAELTIQYGEYALWQREWLEGELLEGQIRYWLDFLRDVPTVLELPTDRPRPPIQTFRGGRVDCRLPARLTTELRAIARLHAATPFAALMALLQIVLARYAGQRDFCVGTSIAGRHHVETESLIGFFVNTQVLRADLRANPSFSDHLSVMGQAVLAAHENQDLPFEKLIQLMQPERNLAYSPLFQVLFAMQPRSKEVRPEDSRPGKPLLEREDFNATFDLNLELGETSDSLRGSLFFNSDLFDRTTVLRLWGHFVALARAAARDPERPALELPMWCEAERQALVHEWNDSAVVRSDETIHGLVEARAAVSPDAVALVAEVLVANGDQALSYAELDRRAEVLAGRLRGLGIAAEEPVGVALERGVSMGVGLLGILKAGGAYVPLDPAYPAERLAFMLDDAGARVVVCESSAFAEEGATSDLGGILRGRECLLLDRGGVSEEIPSSPPLRKGGAKAGSLAYVIYTSGSTGRPKGVGITHRALVNFLASMRLRPGLCADDVLLAVTSLSFDIAGLEFFLPLTVGARVEIADAATAADGEALARRLTRCRATVMQATPVSWRLLLAAGWSGVGKPSAGRPGGGGPRAFCGGEALPTELASALGGRCAEVWNLYGPTETTVWSTVERVDGAVTIGRPIADTTVDLRDRPLRVVSTGAFGELMIGGQGLARGYLGRPALTAERFIPDPLGRAPGERLYRSGDLGRRLADGRLDALGRLDHQVKVRGFRIELGEIEAALSRSPEVEAAVAAVRRPAGDERLLAWVVPAGDRDSGGPDTGLEARLRATLRSELPAYMVPTAIVILDSLPLTANRKVDRAALPDPLEEASGEAPAGEALNTPTEEVLAAIWGRLLGRDRVSADDDFFALGGHSLLATRLLAQVRESFDVSLPLRVFFQAPTLAELARRIGAARRGGESSAIDLPRIIPDPEAGDQPFPLTEIQQAYWVGRSGAFELGSVASHLYQEVDLADLDVERFSLAWRRLIERHGMLRAVVDTDGRQRILAEVPPYEIATVDLRGRPDALQVLAEIRAEMSHQVLQSARWPLFDLRASHLPSGRTRLHISIDLLIGDGWSFRLLIAEIQALYQDPRRRLPELELSFRDYVLAETALRESAAWSRAEEYWQKRLPELPPAPQLPLAKDPSEVVSSRFKRRSGRLSRPSWEALKQRATGLGLTSSGLLLAAFSEVLGAWSRSPRFTLNLTLFNRLAMHPQVHRIVGDFTSITLLEVDTGRPGSTFTERALELRRQLWDDLDHQIYSGVRVLRELARERRMRGAVMPVVFTSLLNLGDEEDKERRPPSEQPTPEQPTSEQTSQDAEEERAVSISQTPQVWLDHQAAEHRGDLIYNWDGVEELFPSGLLDDLFAAYADLLERLAEDDDLWRRESLDLAPRKQLTHRAEINATAAPLPSGLLHEPFLARARERPGHTAVIAGERSLTYGELEAGSSRVAARLLDAPPASPRRGGLVAVVMEKGWEQVVAVLGVLRAGGAYLPIDARLPEARKAWLLEHGEVRVVITQARFAKTLAWPESIRVIAVDESLVESLPAGPAPPSVPSPATPDDLAYVIYTSGSTGRPKGVVIDHRSALNTLVDINRRFAVSATDRVLGVSALHFDLSVYDVFGILSVGATLVLPEARANPDPVHWLDLVERHQVTLWNSVPALLEMMIEVAQARQDGIPLQDGGLSSLRTVMLSGDWIPFSLPPATRRLAGEDTAVVSLGGATEGSIWSILHPVDRVESTSLPSIPYGRPMDNQSFHVLDARLDPRPVWVPGELFIGGAGLARGYWREPAKTAARFVPHPVGGGRLYRTGDLGRYLPDGAIEFLGREDFQVKVGGHRIELGEIETALAGLDEVRSAVVTATGDPRGQRRLVAWVVAAGGVLTEGEKPLDLLTHKLSEPGLRRDLGERRAVDLSVPRADEGFLAPFLRRRSHRAFSHDLLAPASLARLLAMAEEHAAALGAGIEIRLGAHRLADLAPGLYRFREGRFERLSAAVLKPGHVAAVNRGIVEQAAFAIFLLAPRRAAPGRPLLAAGALSQRFMEEAPDCGIGLCPLGDCAPEALRASEDDGLGLLHLLVGGPLAGESAAVSEPVASEPVASEPVAGDGFDPTASLRQVLAAMVQVRMDDQPLPKYRYPSAGDLYPVQVYVAVASGFGGVAPGFYYHDPRGHRLLELAVAPPVDLSEAGFALFLGAELTAIEPVYGDLALPFCRLEAGYLCELVGVVAAAAGWRLQPIAKLPDGLGEALGENRLVLGGLLGTPSARAVSEAMPRTTVLPVAPAVEMGFAAARGDGLAARLRGELGALLPAYMVPSNFHFLSTLPLTANGKVDRGALTSSAAASRVAETSEVATPAAGAERPASTEMEMLLHGIWCRILKRETVGVDDNFFEIGGSSVHLVRVYNLLRQTTGRELPIVDFFENPTIARLAAHLGGADGDGGAESIKRPPSAPASSVEDRRHRRAARRQTRLARRRAGDREADPS